jgi:HD-GYP domain-containing protein (c-di-GMP phosphodiesterase class II)
MSVAEAPVGIINVTDRRGDKPLTHTDMLFLAHVADAASIAVSGQRERLAREEANFDTIRSLALAVEAKDRYTSGHSERVARRSTRMAERLGLEAREVEGIERGAVLHDVGKIGVPERILHKPGALTDREAARIRLHPVIGERVVSQLAFMADGLQIVRNHHERMDGCGYPDGVAAGELPVGVRIVAVADAYDAMTSERPYRRPMSPAEAVAELRACSGTQFDRPCVEALVELLSEEGVPVGVGGRSSGAPA